MAGLGSTWGNDMVGSTIVFAPSPLKIQIESTCTSIYYGSLICSLRPHENFVWQHECFVSCLCVFLLFLHVFQHARLLMESEQTARKNIVRQILKQRAVRERHIVEYFSFGICLERTIHSAPLFFPLCESASLYHLLVLNAFSLTENKNKWQNHNSGGGCSIKGKTYLKSHLHFIVIRRCHQSHIVVWSNAKLFSTHFLEFTGYRWG